MKVFEMASSGNQMARAMKCMIIIGWFTVFTATVEGDIIARSDTTVFSGDANSLGSARGSNSIASVQNRQNRNARASQNNGSCSPLAIVRKRMNETRLCQDIVSHSSGQPSASDGQLTYRFTLPTLHSLATITRAKLYLPVASNNPNAATLLQIRKTEETGEAGPWNDFTFDVNEVATSSSHTSTDTTFCIESNLGSWPQNNRPGPFEVVLKAPNVSTGGGTGKAFLILDVDNRGIGTACAAVQPYKK